MARAYVSLLCKVLSSSLNSPRQELHLQLLVSRRRKHRSSLGEIEVPNAQMSQPELPKEIILTNFYARLSRQDKEMLDASSSGIFQTRSMEEKWNLIKSIQKNTEDWEIDKGIEPVINYVHDYIESYVKTNYFNTFCSKIGLDSQLMIDFCKDFASHVDSSKKKESQHHKPFKESP